MRKYLQWAILVAATVSMAALCWGAGSQFRFAAYGDCRDGHEVHRKIVRQMLTGKPAFVIATGDFVDRGDNEAAWQIFADIVSPIKSAIPYYPIIGNHDLEHGGKGYYKKNLGFSSNTGQMRYYSLNYGNSHFIVLDSTNLDEQQLQWLQADLKSSEKKFKHRFAAFHYPLWTLVPRSVEATEKVRQQLQATLTAAKLCGVFLGHDHYFYMTKQEGVTYMTTGGGGAALYDMDESLAHPGDKYCKCNHFIRVTVSSKRATAEVRDPAGKVLDQFVICSH